MMAYYHVEGEAQVFDCKIPWYLGWLTSLHLLSQYEGRKTRYAICYRVLFHKYICIVKI